MKTNPFDESLRKKLEGVQPEFTEQDWHGFRKYVKAHTSADFWKVNKNWITLVAAASVFFGVIGLCGILYQQNRLLRSEMEALREVVAQEIRSKSHETANSEEEIPFTGLMKSDTEKAKTPGTISENTPTEAGLFSENNQLAVNRGFPQSERIESFHFDTVTNDQNADISGVGDESESNEIEGITRGLSGFEALEYIQTGRVPIELTETSKISAPTIQTGKRPIIGAEKKVAKSSEIKKPKKQKRTLPEFVTSRPYRVGLSVSGTKQSRSFGVINEFLVGNRFSLAWGLTSTKFNDLYFLNEKTFAEQTSYNFRYTFGNGIPKGGYISNISAECSVMQVPLSLGYRHALAGGFTLTGNVGTHLNARFRQSMECDLWDGYKPQRLSGLHYKKLNYPLVNNVNTAIGVEKNFDPIVFQGELFYHFQSRDIPYLDASEAGVRFKLLYQFGR